MTVQVDLLDVAEANDNFFVVSTVEQIEQANRIASLLTAFGATPLRRQAQHNTAHMLFAATLLIVAKEHDGEFELGTRDSTQLSKLSLGSGVLQWLQKAVEANLLELQGSTYKLTPVLIKACEPLSDIEVINA